MVRTLAIGDIHGGFKALIQVLEKAGVTEKDTLIFLGDYVNGWSGSSRVIQFLIELSGRQECIFIKGNHDAWCEDWLCFEKSETYGFPTAAKVPLTVIRIMIRKIWTGILNFSESEKLLCG